MQDYGSIGNWIFLFIFLLNDGTDHGTRIVININMFIVYTTYSWALVFVSWNKNK